MRVTAATKAATRQTILDVAQRLFARHGFDGTTTRDIARAAEIGVGTLFNYFATKEAIALALVADAWTQASESFAASWAPVVAAGAAGTAVPSGADSVPDSGGAAEATVAEALFAHTAALLRKLKPFRKYLPTVLELWLSPATAAANRDEPSLQAAHLETTGRIVSRHGLADAGSALAWQLYWTLLVGVLAFWSRDASPRQEDTLALLDQSMAMFASWLVDHRQPSEGQPKSTGDPRQSATSNTQLSRPRTPKKRG